MIKSARLRFLHIPTKQCTLHGGLVHDFSCRIASQYFRYSICLDRERFVSPSRILYFNPLAGEFRHRMEMNRNQVVKKLHFHFGTFMHFHVDIYTNKISPNPQNPFLPVHFEPFSHFFIIPLATCELISKNFFKK